MSQPRSTAERFHEALRDENWEALETALTDDVQWILPGDNLIAGVTRGRKAVVDRARQNAAYNMRFDVRHVLVGVDDVALIQHNTADTGSGHYDEFVATTCHLRDGRIAEIRTLVSDLAAFDRFFVTAP